MKPLLLLSALLALGHTLLAWTPGTGSPTAASGFIVDPTNRTDVLAFYNTIYPASENFAADLAWTGDTPTGVAGTTGAAFKEDVRRRLNLLPSACIAACGHHVRPVKSGKCQQAALMMSRNRALNHTPPTSWFSYTPEGAEAAERLESLTGHLRTGGHQRADAGQRLGNEVAGHRRWILYSRAQSMGTGDVPSDPSNVQGDQAFPAAHATWVIGDLRPRPAAQFITWPNRGFLSVSSDARALVTVDIRAPILGG